MALGTVVLVRLYLGKSLVSQEPTYLTAAKRHAGGAAKAKRAETAKKSRPRVDLAANIVRSRIEN